jgi:Fe-S-cluster containining protein
VTSPEVTVRATPTGARHLLQPCTALEGTTCRCYPGRPLACRRYRCALLDALDAEEVDLDQAREVVAAVRAFGPGAAPDGFLTFHFGRR